MKILHIAESARGGVGTYIAEVLPAQVRQFGVDGVCALLPDRHASHVSGVDRRTVRTWRRNERSLFNLLRLALAIRAAIRTFQPSVVHAHSSFAGAVVRLMYGWRRRPFQIIYCPHGWGFDRRSRAYKNQAIAAIERRLAAWCEGIVVISEHEHRQARRIGIPDEKLALILNGLSDTPPVRAARWDDHRLRVLFIGRLDHQKGFDTLIDAVEPFQDQICVRVVGTAVAGAVSHRSGGNQIEHLGWRSLAEIAPQIAAADVVVMPSRWEGFGLVALEAMRGARPIVASAVGGLREIVVDGQTGRLVPPDSPEQLGRALRRGNVAEWRRLGAAGRERYLEHFTAERMNRQLVELYRAVGATRGPPQPADRRSAHA